jgi:hypothetical protein
MALSPFFARIGVALGGGLCYVDGSVELETVF